MKRRNWIFSRIHYTYKWMEISWNIIWLKWDVKWNLYWSLICACVCHQAADTISDLEQHVDQLKRSLKDSEDQRQRQIRVRGSTGWRKDSMAFRAQHLSWANSQALLQTWINEACLSLPQIKECLDVIKNESCHNILLCIILNWYLVGDKNVVLVFY